MPANVFCRVLRKFLIANNSFLSISFNGTACISQLNMAPNVTHYEKIVGRSPEHANDILFSSDSYDVKEHVDQERCAKEKKFIVYFGGDVQDLTEKMKMHRDNKNYLQWSLEETAALLARSYPDHSIMVVRPKRMERATFSCYDNFVESNYCGAPTHLTKSSSKDSPTYTYCHALLQIQALIQNLICQISNTDTKDDTKSMTVTDNITLIGFSKGVVVLNQVLHDLHMLHEDSQDNNSEKQRLKEFSNQIERMIWLDGGHNGGKDTWITDESVLETLANKTNIYIEVKVTPYQVKDNRRPWIGQEEKRFRNILGNKLQLYKRNRLKRDLYFENQEANIDNHFKILTTLGCDK